MGNLKYPQSLHNYLYTNSDPINNWDPTGRISASVAIAINIGVVAFAGASFSVIGNGLYNWSHGKNFLDNWGQAATLGAGAAIACGFFPFLGIGLAGLGLGLSLLNAGNILFDNNATSGQKLAAVSLVLFSSVGAVMAASYGAAASNKGHFLFNRNPFPGINPSTLRTSLGKLYEYMNLVRQVKIDFKKTIGLFLYRNKGTNEIKMAIMSNEKNGYVRPEVMNALPENIPNLRIDPRKVPQQNVWKNNPHTEVRIATLCEENNWDCLIIITNRPACSRCQTYMFEQGIGLMQPMEFPVMPFVPLNEYDPCIDEYDEDDWYDWDN